MERDTRRRSRAQGQAQGQIGARGRSTTPTWDAVDSLSGSVRLPVVRRGNACREVCRSGALHRVLRPLLIHWFWVRIPGGAPGRRRFPGCGRAAPQASGIVRGTGPRAICPCGAAKRGTTTGEPHGGQVCLSDMLTRQRRRWIRHTTGTVIVLVLAGCNGDTESEPRAVSSSTSGLTSPTSEISVPVTTTSASPGTITVELDRVRISLWHCGIEPIRYDGQLWGCQTVKSLSTTRMPRIP